MTRTADHDTPRHSNQSNGWLFLLPPLSGCRLLCIDSEGSLTRLLAAECREVVVLRGLVFQAATVPQDDAQLASRARCATLAELRNALEAADSATDRFDGFVVQDPQGLEIHSDSIADLEAVLAEVRQLVKPEGFVYVGGCNAWSLQRIQHRLRGRSAPRSVRPASVRALVRTVKRAAIGPSQLHPFMMQGSRIEEVLGSAGFRSTKNRELSKERIKEGLLGPLGSRLFASAYGVIACGVARRDSVIDVMLQRVSLLGNGGPGGPFVVKQFLVFAGHKAIVSIGIAGTARHDRVVVMVADALSKRRRQAEVTTLETLSHLPAALAARVPRVLGQFEIERTLCIVLNRFPGVTLDAEVGPIESVTDSALEFLIEFHLATAQTIAIDAPAFERLFVQPLDAACARNPGLAHELQALLPLLSERTRGVSLPTVWSHGDFKVENVMYEPRSRRITGVIDWEHADRCGLPLLDLLYLLVYNRGIRGADWIEASTDLLVRDWPTPEERRRMQLYAGALQVEARLLPALAIMFVVHHIGARMHLPSDFVLQSRVRDLLLALGAVLGRRPATT